METPPPPAVLILDHDLVARLIERMLARVGFLATVVNGAESAIAFAAATPPAAAMVSWSLLGDDLPDFVIRLRRETPFGASPIIALSGRPVFQDDLTRVGMDGHVAKPFTAGSLVEALRAFGIDGAPPR